MQPEISAGVFEPLARTLSTVQRALCKVFLQFGTNCNIRQYLRIYKM